MEIENQSNVSQKSTVVQVLLGLIVSFSSLAPSMSIGFSAVALPYLTDVSNARRLTGDEASWFASIASIAAPLGCLLSGPISDRFGRKPAIICVNVVCFLGWAIITVAYYFPNHQFLLLLIGRLFTGFSTGLSSMPAAVYMAEIATPKLRGLLITWNALCFSLGIVIIYALGWIMTENWGLVAALSAAFPCAGLAMVMTYMVESPSWLITKHRYEDAKRKLRKLFNSREVDEEYETLIRNVAGTRTECEDYRFRWRHFLEPVCYKPLILMSMFFIFQQFSGTFVILSYAIDIVNEAKISIDLYGAIVLIAATRAVTSAFVSIASKRVGRRPLSLCSGIGMTVSMVLLSGYLFCIKRGIITDDRFAWVPLTLLMTYFFTATLGFLTMPFAMSAEVFPSKIRGLATGMVTSIAYTANFILVKLYPDMLHGMGISPLFLFYGAMSAVGTIFVMLRLPETNGKTLMEIERYFRNESRNNGELERVQSTCFISNNSN